MPSSVAELGGDRLEHGGPGVVGPDHEVGVAAGRGLVLGGLGGGFLGHRRWFRWRSVVSEPSVVSVASVFSVDESLESSSLPHAAPTRAATAAKAIKRRDARMVSPPQEVMVPAGAGEVVGGFTVFVVAPTARVVHTWGEM